MSTKITLIYDEQLYVESLVQSITWSGERSQPFRKLEVKLSNTLNGKNRAIYFQKGRRLRFLVNERELFRGFIFSDSIDLSGDATLTAYDDNMYLTKSKDTKKLVNQTASDFIRQLCSQYGLAVGEIVDTKYKIPKFILREKSLWEMCLIALTETTKQTGERYYVTSEEGKLNLRKVDPERTLWTLASGLNLKSASLTQSIEELRNQVKIMGSDGEETMVASILSDTDSIRRYGLMQHLETADGKSNSSQLSQLAKQRLKEMNKIDSQLKVEAVGNVELISGASVRVEDAMTAVSASFYVSSDSHTFELGDHQMSLDLSTVDELPQMENDSTT